MYSLYRIMYSDLNQREGLLSTYHVDTIITIDFICVYTVSSFFTNCYYFRSLEKRKKCREWLLHGFVENKNCLLNRVLFS